LTVSLSGDGGDEVFGGYPRYKVAQKLMHLRKIRLFLNAFKFIPHKGFQNGLKLVNGKLEDFYNNARPDFYKPKITREILSGQLSKCLEKTGGNLQEAVRLMDIYFYTLSENFLLKVDRASMANALEVRCPFLDHRLVELSMQIPSELKCSMFRDKILLRKILKGHLPIEIINRKKAGFTPPINKWIMNSEYIDEIREAIEVLSNSGVLSKEWKEFYASKIMKEDNLVCNNYKIRMFLFYRWYKRWII
jgi:asparagine synthase (glutamine-hydrolysing)